MNKNLITKIEKTLKVLGTDKHRTHAYALSVVKKEIIAGPDIRNAFTRHLDDLMNADKRGFYFDENAANRVFRFFETVLKLNGGEFENQPFKLLDWQCFILGNLFGWLRTNNNKRRFKKAYVETGKGSGKSPLSAGIGLYGMIADKEGSAEIYAAASKKDQAQILFRDAVKMVQQSPSLSSKIHLSGKNPVWNMSFNGGFFKPISSEGGQSGPRPHIALIDELHEHKSSDLIEMMIAGTKGREQPLIFMITNSGHDRSSVCYEYHEHCKKIAAQVVNDDTFFTYICSLDKGDDPFKDEACWAKANPSLGHTIKYDYLKEQVDSARGMPSKESIVRRLNFCEWVDAIDPWITSDVFEQVWSDFDYSDLHGLECYGGLDLSGTKDLTALALYFPEIQKLIIEYWSPGDTLQERSRRDHVPYDAWVKQGFMHAPAGQSVDYRDIAIRLAELQNVFSINSIAFDPYRISHLTPFLDEFGVDIELISHGQGYGKSQNGLWMPHSIDLIEKEILDQTIIFQKNPCTRWCVSGAVIEADRQDNRIFNKNKATHRIDGIVAAAMARGCAEIRHTSKKANGNYFFI